MQRRTNPHSNRPPDCAPENCFIHSFIQIIFKTCSWSHSYRDTAAPADKHSSSSTSPLGLTPHGSRKINRKPESSPLKMKRRAELQEADGNIDNENTKDISFKTRTPACLEQEGIQPARYSSVLPTHLLCISAPSLLTLPALCSVLRADSGAGRWGQGGTGAGARFDSSALWGQAAGARQGRAGFCSPATAHRCQMAAERTASPQILILKGLIVEMSCTSVQNERRDFSFQHRHCSSEPGSEPSLPSLFAPPFPEPSLPAVPLASTARQVQLGTLPGPITSTAHSLLLQAMICSASSYFSSYFSLPRRTIKPPNSISPTVILFCICVSAFESCRKRDHEDRGGCQAEPRTCSPIHLASSKTRALFLPQHFRAGAGNTKENVTTTGCMR